MNFVQLSMYLKEKASLADDIARVAGYTKFA